MQAVTALYSSGTFQLSRSQEMYRTIHLSDTDSQETVGEQQPPTVEHKLIARIDEAHGVHEVNAVAWCPREGMEGVLATVGDDGHVKVWKMDIRY